MWGGGVENLTTCDSPGQLDARVGEGRGLAAHLGELAAVVDLEHDEKKEGGGTRKSWEETKLAP